MREYDIVEVLDFAKQVYKKMGKNAVMVANSKFDEFMFNFIISDGVNIISADYLQLYFYVKDGEKEMYSEPPTPYSLRRIYSLGLRFLKKHVYTEGLNCEIKKLIPLNFNLM